METNTADPKEVSPGVWYIPLPIPVFVSGNAYLIVDDKITLIDAGHHAAVTSGVFEKQLHRIGYTFSDISQIIYTHHHQDHSGGGSAISQNHTVKHVIKQSITDKFRNANKLYESMRFTPRNVLEYYPMFESFVEPDVTGDFYIRGCPHVDPLIGEITGVNHGEIIDLGKRKLSVITCPGHSEHDIVLLDRENGLLFSGDALLNISFSFFEGSDMGQYLQSMHDLEELDAQVKLILPGHGEPINTSLKAICENSRRPILKLCDRIISYLCENGQLSAVEIFTHFYSKHVKSVRRPAIFSTLLGYLRYLVSEGRIVECEDQPGSYYAAR